MLCIIDGDTNIHLCKLLTIGWRARNIELSKRREGGGLHVGLGVVVQSSRSSSNTFALLSCLSTYLHFPFSETINFPFPLFLNPWSSLSVSSSLSLLVVPFPHLCFSLGTCSFFFSYADLYIRSRYVPFYLYLISALLCHPDAMRSNRTSMRRISANVAWNWAKKP